MVSDIFIDCESYINALIVGGIATMVCNCLSKRKYKRQRQLHCNPLAVVPFYLCQLLLSMRSQNGKLRVVISLGR